MTNRPRVLLLIPHLGGGGAEQVFETLARRLSPEKYELHLGLVTKANAEMEPLPGWVAVHYLKAGRVRRGALRLLLLIWRLRPDLILSGMAHLNFLVLALRPFFPRRTRILVRQNGSVSSPLASIEFPLHTQFCYRFLYRRAHRIICQSVAMADEICSGFQIPPRKIIVLYNPIDIDAIRVISANANLSWSGSGPHLLAVGRLANEKGFDLLLEAFAVVRRQFPNATLAIAGIGPSDAALKSLRDFLRLRESVRFLGQIASPAEYFKGASLFVLSSRHEGMPNALLEAAAAGLPLVALPASGGLVDLLRGQPGVWIAPKISAESLASELLGALSAMKNGKRFDHPWIEPFRVDRSIAAYENLIDSTLRERCG